MSPQMPRGLPSPDARDDPERNCSFRRIAVPPVEAIVASKKV